MNKIELRQVLPNVFRSRNDIVSEVWHKEIEFSKGEKCLIEANSGTGKSSLCSFVYGYRNDYIGNILFDDEDISRFSIKEWINLRKKHIALLWQDLRLFPELTSMENVLLKNKLTGFQKKKQILEWFEELGISDKKDVKIGMMSYGQQQRVAMIRTLCQPFDFIFVDEPISHLDDVNGEIMGRIVTEEAHRQGAGVIVTSIGKRLDITYDKILKL
jgi:ABC-type lipoprotein export system ATPase subunit